MNSRRCWSAWEMVRYHEALFLTVMLHLDRPHQEWVAGTVTDAQYRANLTERLDHVRAAASECKLSSVVNQIDQMKRWIKPDCDVKTIMAMAMNLVGTIQMELTNDLFLRVPKDERDYYEKIPMSKRAADAFPSAEREMSAAGRCYALDEWTASVLHSMRALEFPLKAMVQALNFVPSNPNWEMVLNECEREINKIGPQSSTNWKEDKSFYSDVALTFRFYKNAWRNHAAHGHETYDQRDAHSILVNVGDFMDKAATHLKEI
jgi:hypothetical protein